MYSVGSIITIHVCSLVGATLWPYVYTYTITIHFNRVGFELYRVCLMPDAPCNAKSWLCHCIFGSEPHFSYRVLYSALIYQVDKCIDQL